MQIQQDIHPVKDRAYWLARSKKQHRWFTGHILLRAARTERDDVSSTDDEKLADETSLREWQIEEERP